jgi:hypothetical protein
VEPDLFLRFHDTFVDRSKWSKNADWRKNVGTVDYKVLAAVYVAVGLFFVFLVGMRLLS